MEASLFRNAVLWSGSIVNPPPMHTAFLLAAGFGTRLRPLTERVPKPLVPVCGVPMLDYVLAHCSSYGLSTVVVNAHYLPEQVEDWAARLDGEVSVTVSVELPEILGTGGGLKRVAGLLADRLVVLNGDVLCDVDLSHLMGTVPSGGAVMVLRPNEEDARDKYGIVATDAEARVVDLKKMAVTEPVGATRWDSHFTGIHALDRAVLSRVPDGFGCIVRTAYLELVPERNLLAVRHDGIWLDVGDPAAYLATNLAVLRGEVRLHMDPMLRAHWFTRSGGTFESRVQVGVSGAAWIGADVNFGEGVLLNDAIVGDGASVEAGASLEECVVWPGAQVSGGVWQRCIFYDNEVLEIGYLAD